MIQVVVVKRVGVERSFNSERDTLWVRDGGPQVVVAKWPRVEGENEQREM